jgi:SPP1 family predicted phage head-tail adaptor
MKDPKIGPMRNRVEIQSRTVAQDSYGQAVPTWTTLATVAAEVLPLSGREMWQAQQARPQVTHKVTIRFYSGLTAKHRLLFDGATLNIDSVLNPDGRKRFHELICVEQVQV